MRVIVAVDGSGPAADAVALVNAIAWPNDAMLRVIGVIEPTLPMVGLSMKRFSDWLWSM